MRRVKNAGVRKLTPGIFLRALCLRTICLCVLCSWFCALFDFARLISARRLTLRAEFILGAVCFCAAGGQCGPPAAPFPPRRPVRLRGGA